MHPNPLGVPRNLLSKLWLRGDHETDHPLYGTRRGDIDFVWYKAQNSGSVTNYGHRSYYITVNTGGYRRRAVSCRLQSNSITPPIVRGRQLLLPRHWYGLSGAVWIGSNDRRRYATISVTRSVAFTATSNSGGTAYVGSTSSFVMETDGAMALYISCGAPSTGGKWEVTVTSFSHLLQNGATLSF